MKKKIAVITIMALMMLSQGLCGGRVFADEGVDIKEGDTAIGVSPMRESIVLNPGDEYRSSFSIVNPDMTKQDLYYKVDVQPFSVNENYDFIYDEMNDSTQIVKWINIESPNRGMLHPNETATIEYIIKVPENAPDGGQYASLTVSTDFEATENAGVNINEAMSIAHLILAEVAGNTTHGGDILDVKIDKFAFERKLQVYSIVQNTGNVHALATYTMRIKSVFSDEILYSNEDMPETHYVLPNRTYYDETVWDETPTIGIFDVLYTVEFQGLKSEVSGIVIVCPWWALLIAIFMILMLVLRIATLIALRKRRRDKDDKEI